MAVKGGTSEWCTTIRRHLTTSSLVLVKSKVQSNAWQVVRHLTENIGSRESWGANVEVGRKGAANRVLLTIILLTGIKHLPTALFISVQGENNATW